MNLPALTLAAIVGLSVYRIWHTNRTLNRIVNHGACNVIPLRAKGPLGGLDD